MNALSPLVTEAHASTLLAYSEFRSRRLVGM